MSRLFALATGRRTPRSSPPTVPEFYPHYDHEGNAAPVPPTDPRINRASPDLFVPHRPKQPVELTSDSPSIFGRAPSFSISPFYTGNGRRRREKKERKEKRERGAFFRREKREPPSAPAVDAAERLEDSEDSETPWQNQVIDSNTAERDRLIFAFRKNRPSEVTSAEVPGVDDNYFGAHQHEEHSRAQRPQDPASRPGEQVLLRFLQATLGTHAEVFAERMMNKKIGSSVSFTYTIHQGTEEVDLDCISRDISNGRVYKVGRKLEAGSWCNLLLGDRFTVKGGKRQRHELTYVRESCTCIRCSIREAEALRELASGGSGSGSGSGAAADLVSLSSATSRTPVHSAMANFVVTYSLPSTSDLKSIGGSSSWRELEIGTIIRLNSRPAAKLKFTEDVRQLFGHLAYTGPIGHEEIYRKVTTIGVDYYLYNKGKKERKVYIQGDLVRLPINIGVVKLGTQPMYMDDLGATFVLYRSQIMSIYVGEIVLEGNSIGSFIKTGIRYYIGFGEERGACAVYPNKKTGPQRKLGINELLLHHHMVSDLSVHLL